jgi:hypothetical protein
VKFEKGHTKLGGKKKGTENKTTSAIKEAYQKLIENNLDNLTDWLKQIAASNPEKAIYILSDLSEYVIPKLARTDITSGDEPIKQDLTILVDNSETAKEFQRMKDELAKME